MSIRRSRRAGRSATPLRNRRPRRWSSDRSATSGRVFALRFPFIAALTADEVGWGYGRRSGDEFEFARRWLIGRLILRERAANRQRDVVREAWRDSVSNLAE